MSGAGSVAALVARERLIGAAINAVLGILFFLGLFGLKDPVPVRGFGQLAFDFVPQGGAGAFMTCLASLVVARRAVRIGAVLPKHRRPGPAASLLHCLAWAAAGAGLGVLAGLLLAATGTAALGWSLALMLKILFGALLGAGITQTMLRRLLCDPVLQPKGA